MENVPHFHTMVPHSLIADICSLEHTPGELEFTYLSQGQDLVATPYKQSYLLMVTYGEEQSEQMIEFYQLDKNKVKINFAHTSGIKALVEQYRFKGVFFWTPTDCWIYEL